MPLQIIEENRKPTFLETIFSGLEKGKEAFNQAREKQQLSQQKKSLANILGLGEEAENLPMEAQLKTSEMNRKQEESYLKRLQEQRESESLRKIRSGEQLTEEEESYLSPTSQRSLIREEKPLFEEESEKLSAKRSADVYQNVMDSYQSAVNEDMRLNRMEKLDEKDELSTPLMMKTMNALGLPIGILSNPNTEEFQKLEADFVRDVSKVFPGQIRVYEIQSYMKTVPGMANSREGRKRIINNRRIFNEAAKLKGNALKDIIKENKGRTPRNLDILIEEKIGPQLNALGEQFKEGINETVEDFSITYNVKAPDGRVRKIPANRLKDALNAGGELL